MEKKTDASKEQIEKFLKDFKDRMRWINPPIIYVDMGNNNLQSLATLDITGDKLNDIIKALVPEDYMGGPYENNFKGQGDVWVFGKEIKGTDIYIKIYINTTLNQPNICISFHISTSTNLYPLKTQTL